MIRLQTQRSITQTQHPLSHACSNVPPPTQIIAFFYNINLKPLLKTEALKKKKIKGKYFKLRNKSIYLTYALKKINLGWFFASGLLSFPSRNSL